jgi:hypothetical protein
MILPKIILAAFFTVCMFFSSQGQNVGVGTTTPESKLQVAGKITADSLKIMGGAGTGKVLTSDSAGNAKWIPSANIVQANNGVVIDTGTIQLGGALSKKTKIDIAGHHFKITKPGGLLSGMLVNNVPDGSSMILTGSHSLFQSFTSPQDATLDSIQIFVRTQSASNIRAYLYQGHGVTGLLLDSSELFSYPEYTGSTRVTVFKKSRPMEASKVYSIYISGVGGWVLNPNGTYPSGSASLFGADLCFTIFATYNQENGITIKPNGEVSFFGHVSISGSTMFEFGHDILPKEINAGKIGYQTFTPGALDIVGAGTETGNRKLTVWAEGGATFKGPVTATSLSASIEQEAIQTPTLVGGWAAYGSGFAPPGFWKDKEGVVHLRGLVGNPAPVPINGTLLCTLPPGYRPSGGTHIFSVTNNNQMARIDIAADGSVIIASITSNVWLNLTGISFRTN